jgi:hypothetical protein
MFTEEVERKSRESNKNPQCTHLDCNLSINRKEDTALAPASMSRNARGSARSTPTKNFDAAIQKKFEQYKEAELNNDDEQYIGVEGLEKLCAEMVIDPQSRVLILLQKECGSTTMGELTQSEFLAGMTKLGFDDDPYTLKKVGTKLKNADRAMGHPSSRASSGTSTEFSELYKYTFELCRESKMKKVIDKSIALGMFQLVLGESKLHHVAPLCAFLENKGDINAINIDQWACMLDFVATIKPDFSNYSEDEAWPVMLDDYVEDVRKNSA